MQSLKPGFLLLEVATLGLPWYLRLCGAAHPDGREGAPGRCGGCQGRGAGALFLPLLCQDLRKETAVSIYHLLPGPLSGSCGHTRPEFLPWVPSRSP